MADSVITKKAIAESLKKLMKEKPFEKISVAEICEECGLTRKSFYYHFKDKYDLVSWIFDHEFLGKRTGSSDTIWYGFSMICLNIFMKTVLFIKSFSQQTVRTVFMIHLSRGSGL